MSPTTIQESKLRNEPETTPTSKPAIKVEPESPQRETAPEPVPTFSDYDPKLNQSNKTSIQSNDAHSSLSGEPASLPELRKDQGSRTFTMRELLNGLKGDIKNDGANDSEAEREDANSPYSEQSTHLQDTNQNNPAMELINSVTGADEEGRSRQRILTFAARRYASAIERNPEDYDALYNWALVLQESADNVSPDSTSPSKDALLEEACKKYDEATRLCPTLHDAFYNWAIAISDRAKMRGRTKEAEELWKQATQNYEKAVRLNWNSPQALNNWGLALQELSAIVPAREKHKIVRTAISKFRAAIRLQFDFHRAIYNLGTVLYGLAEDMIRTGGSASSKEVSPNELYSQSAIYIAAAHALKPNYSVYSSALRLVRSMLPLPFLKAGYLTAPPAGKAIAPHCDWRRSEFLLNHDKLQQVKFHLPAKKNLSAGDLVTVLDLRVTGYIHCGKLLMNSPPPPGCFLTQIQVNKAEQKQVPQNLLGRSIEALNNDRKTIRVDIPDIVSVSACADLTLPPGAGLCIDTINGPVFLVADSWEALDGWLDAIRLAYTIYARGKSDVLAGMITG